MSGGVSTAYDQLIVLLIKRSNASPEAAWVICAKVSAGGEETINVAASCAGQESVGVKCFGGEWREGSR